MEIVDIATIVASVVVALIGILLPIAGMFLWNRAEANSDRKDIHQKIEATMQKMDAKMDSNMQKTETNMQKTEASIQSSIQKMDQRIEENRKETRDIIDSIQQEIRSNAKETRDLINAIKEEAKEFHARLCVIESKRKTIIIKKASH